MDDDDDDAEDDDDGVADVDVDGVGVGVDAVYGGVADPPLPLALRSLAPPAPVRCCPSPSSSLPDGVIINSPVGCL